MVTAEGTALSERAIIAYMMHRRLEEDYRRSEVDAYSQLLTTCEGFAAALEGALNAHRRGRCRCAVCEELRAMLYQANLFSDALRAILPEELVVLFGFEMEDLVNWHDDLE